MGKSALREFVKPDTLKLLDIYESVMQTYQNLCRGPPVIKTRTPVLNGNMYKRWVIKVFFFFLFLFYYFLFYYFLFYYYSFYSFSFPFS